MAIPKKQLEIPKKQATQATGSALSVNKPDKASLLQPAENGHLNGNDVKLKILKLVSQPSNGPLKPLVDDNQKEQTLPSVSQLIYRKSSTSALPWRPFKIIYGLDCLMQGL